MFRIICNYKNILHLYGISLDYYDLLINVVFQFINPNVRQTCGCPKSFGIQ